MKDQNGFGLKEEVAWLFLFDMTSLLFIEDFKVWPFDYLYLSSLHLFILETLNIFHHAESPS